MPHNVGMWVHDDPDQFVIIIDEDLITEDGAKLLQAACNLVVHHWQRLPTVTDRARLRLHTG
ncbi:hypothetical protein NLX86_19140 [Streptomyces sp. A3M-1-3]|uniref:hypothetical protein n=1 Tax=Streptomyces sp. A3M-1-3 TaxID=2962044 RepID=UPI0020B89AC8|nr:hypothetical protein [Streptomyces sp. A3M-1-3]MCP3820135.1 hypothetical protein [Streptomyces sp. A3M-1-3]